MKSNRIFTLLLMAIAIQSQAQNVGIGNPTPAEKLDVTGNINVTGTIKANGSAGSANQVLTSNGNGTMNWASIHKYPNSISFKGLLNNDDGTFQTYSFVVPANITEIWAECWEGGDGGQILPATITNTTSAKGGDAGSYVSGIIKVTPGETLTLRVGDGGTSGALGGSTMIYRGFSEVFGINTFGNEYALFDPVTNTDGLLKFVKGESGSLVTFTHVEVKTGSFHRVVTGGKGGDSYPDSKGGTGTTVSYDNLTNATVAYLFNYSIGVNNGSRGAHGATPGGGGGVGYPSIGFAGYGGVGMVILHF
jgi:hypothetical protein